MIRIINCIALAIMLIVNFIAATSGINDYFIGQISELHPTLFTPAAFTYNIWFIIYIGLVAFCIAQFKAAENYNRAINGLFIATCILNAGWLFAWHNLEFFLSVIIMITFLVVLIILYKRIEKVPIEKKRVWALKAPFSIYLAWISVATITNISVYLNKIDFESYPELLTILMITISCALGLVMVGYKHDLLFGLTICWALTGIMLKYWDDPDRENLVITSAVGIILIMVYSIVKKPRYVSKHSH